MSADNGIYILKCNNGCKVLHAQGIDAIYFEPDESGFNHESVREIFAEAELLTEAEADEKAIQLAEDAYYTEYGVCEIDYPFDAPS